MRVALLNQYYWPHHAATSQLLTELGESLAARGHAVTVVTASVEGADGAPAPAREERAGVRIRRVRATRRGKARLIDRALDYGTFYAGAVAELLSLRPAPDVVLALTTPPLIAVAAQLAGRLRGFPTVSLVQDVYPDIAVELGLLSRTGLATRAWRAVAKASLGASERVVVLSEPMRRRILAFGVEPARVDVIANWALAELDETSSGDRMRLRYGFGHRFVVMYSGNMGAGHAFDTLLAAADALREREDIVFAFVGDGVRRAEIERAVAARRLDNVALFDYAAREDLADSLGAADLHVVTMRDGLDGLLMPSKLYGILAAARPGLFIGPASSEVASALAAGACGVSHDNGDVAGVVASVTRLAALPDRGRALGAAGRAHLSRRYARGLAVDAYERVLAEVAQVRLGGAPPTSITGAGGRPGKAGLHE